MALWGPELPAGCGCLSSGTIKRRVKESSCVFEAPCTPRTFEQDEMRQGAGERAQQIGVPAAKPGNLSLTLEPVVERENWPPRLSSGFHTRAMIHVRVSARILLIIF